MFFRGLLPFFLAQFDAYLGQVNAYLGQELDIELLMGVFIASKIYQINENLKGNESYYIYKNGEKEDQGMKAII